MAKYKTFNNLTPKEKLAKRAQILKERKIRNAASARRSRLIQKSNLIELEEKKKSLEKELQAARIEVPEFKCEYPKEMLLRSEGLAAMTSIKEKNKMSAQRSREKNKFYLSKLEAHISLLQALLCRDTAPVEPVVEKKSEVELSAVRSMSEDSPTKQTVKYNTFILSDIALNPNPDTFLYAVPTIGFGQVEYVYEEDSGIAEQASSSLSKVVSTGYSREVSTEAKDLIDHFGDEFLKAERNIFGDDVSDGEYVEYKLMDDVFDYETLSYSYAGRNVFYEPSSELIRGDSHSLLSKRSREEYEIDGWWVCDGFSSVIGGANENALRQKVSSKIAFSF